MSGNLALCRYSAPSAKPIAHGISTKPDRAARAPIAPRSFAPTQTAMPMTFGPGENWMRLNVSANSCSLIQCRRSTTERRAHTSPPPKLHKETLRNSANNAASVTRSSEFASVKTETWDIRHLSCEDSVEIWAEDQFSRAQTCARNLMFQMH